MTPGECVWRDDEGRHGSVFLFLSEAGVFVVREYVQQAAGWVPVLFWVAFETDLFHISSLFHFHTVSSLLKRSVGKQKYDDTANEL